MDTDRHKNQSEDMSYRLERKMDAPSLQPLFRQTNIDVDARVIST